MNSAQTKKQLRGGIVISYVQMALAVVIQLGYTPFMLRVLGDGEYGLLQTALSTAAMLSVLSLGFNAGYIRYYARYRKQGDEQAIYRLNGLFLLVFTVLGAVVMGCGLWLSTDLKAVFRDGLTPQEYELGRVLLIITTLNMALSFPRGVFANIISAHERFVFLKAVSIVESVGAPLLNIAVLLLGMRSVAVALVSLGIGLLVFVLYAVYVLGKLKQRFRFRGFPKGILRDLFAFTGFILINLIVDQVNNQVDKVLLARFCGTAAVTVYTVGINFNNYYTLFSTSVSGIFTPRVHQMVLATRQDSPQQRSELTAFFTKVGRAQFLLLALVASGFVFFGQDFLRLWVGEGYRESYFVALVCMLPATVPLIQNVGIEIQRAENRHHYRSVIYGVIALFNIGISIWLCQIWSAFGAALGTGMACVLGHGLLMNIVYHKKINVDMLFFWKQILRQLLGLLPAFAAGTALMLWVPVKSWPAFAAVAAAYAAVYAACAWLLAMNRQEKQLAASFVSRLKGRFAK